MSAIKGFPDTEKSTAVTNVLQYEMIYCLYENGAMLFRFIRLHIALTRLALPGAR